MSDFDFKYIESYVHDGRIGVLVEFSMDSDFTEKTDEFRSFAKDIALHVTACNPEDIEHLLNQPFIKDVDRSIEELVQETRKHLSDNIAIVRFIRWDNHPGSGVPEGLPPKSSPTLASVVDIRGKKKE